MDTLTEINTELVFYLSESTDCQHLVDCIEDVPALERAAIYNMISDLQQRRYKKKEIAKLVADEVSAVLEGRGLGYAKEFLER